MLPSIVTAAVMAPGALVSAQSARTATIRKKEPGQPHKHLIEEKDILHYIGSR